MTEGPAAAPETPSPPQRWRVIVGRLSFALGVVSCLTCVFGIFAAIPAVLLGMVARMRQPRTDGRVPGVSMANFGIVLGSLGVLVSVVFMFSVSFLFGSRDSSHLAACQNNLKFITVCMKAYAEEHDGVLPDTLSALYPEYVPTANVFMCPASGNKAGDPARVDEWSDYVFVPGLRVTGTPADAATLVCYDRKYHEHHRRKLGRNEAYVDGHVELRRLKEKFASTEAKNP